MLRSSAGTISRNFNSATVILFLFHCIHLKYAAKFPDLFLVSAYHRTDIITNPVTDKSEPSHANAESFFSFLFVEEQGFASVCAFRTESYLRLELVIPFVIYLDVNPFRAVRVVNYVRHLGTGYFVRNLEGAIFPIQYNIQLLTKFPIVLSEFLSCHNTQIGSSI